MSLKENFYQALRELLNFGGLVGSDLEEKAKTRSELDSYLEMPRNSYDQETADPVKKPPIADAAPKPAETESNYFSDYIPDYTPKRETPSDNRYYQPSASSQQPPNSGFNGGLNSFKQMDELTVISKNTVVIGNIKSLASVKIEGNVRGKVDVLKDANVHGMLVGDLTCNNAEMQGSSVQGNVISKGTAYVDNDSIVLGDVAAQYANIDGKIKGNIEVGSKVEFHENAIVAGDIYTNTITVADGANIRGYVTTSYFTEHGDDAFPKQVVIDEDNKS